MIENYPAWLLFFGAFVWLLLRFPKKVTKIYKWQKIMNDRLDGAVDPLEDALDTMHNFSVAARAATAASISLRETFKLNNPFVCGSEDLRKTYRQALMKTFAKTNDDAWVAIARSVTTSIQALIVSEEASGGGTTLRANVMEISRNATLVAMLKALFDIDHVPRGTIMYIGSEIHRLGVWKKRLDAASSNPGAVPGAFLQCVDRLISCLRNLFSEARETNDLARLILCSVSGTPEAFNPLDLLIPAFEAPWRAVFYTLLAVLQDGPTRVDDLQSLRDCPARERPPPRAKAIVFESLRLYPPVRRMRMSRKANIQQAVRMGRIADIDRTIDAEAILRDPRYWGSTAAEWKPSRFIRPNGDLNSSVLCPSAGWLPFAAGGMKCPSAGGFSIRLTAVVVGEILRQLFPQHDQLQWYLEGPEWDLPSAAGQLLRPGREEYICVDVVSRSDRPKACME
ncbi:hypothetical protein BGZ63DRAFT_407137 [Mariannaea sp. PMI_226]|nr:hypothetical protein BGZ63DRAFT_407137 [Mariannaea sp. PMI_226]